ncbi:CshA/CshB family fibrillar adhesin-related protein [Bifidobacterium sp. ESL0732]|uniref:CshA/CshB family fibrillar adhesin-related protein n=1 Tax=Bifidobacterium sp. ESL0732 TaxID=2983222 RepID=UPI0023F950FC|nr:CshA/CshB family fibrillar adhesin-related protein [Bifidobacterium sp. ESL0732]WEV64049.1 CshA/CshB family fibrillar adhesin-related protein [Bifidobacterium sp. ESL0732]
MTRRKAKQPHGIFRKISAIAATAAMALTGLVVAAQPANAVSATGGNGRMLSNINWVEWGNAGERITGKKVTWTTPIEIGGGHWLSTRCSLEPSSGVDTALSDKLPIQAYRTGVYGGDALAQMYYKGGSGNENQLTAGLANVNNRETVTFDFGCAAYLIPSSVDPSATLNDGTNTGSFVPVPLQGLVFADAESNNWTRHQQEYIKATPQGGNPTWRLLDSYRTPGCRTNSIAELKDRTLRFRSDGPQCSNHGGTGPSSAMFLQGSTGAQVTFRGGGETAVALGTIVASDFGDAPQSYGAAGSLFQPQWHGGALGSDITGTTYSEKDPIDPDSSMVGAQSFNLSQARDVAAASASSDTVANFAQPEPRLGDREDSEAEPHFSSGANWDDAHGDVGADGKVINDEDGVDIPADTKAINVTPDSSGSYSLPVRCSGTGDVRGWIDWNHNGKFDEAQASSGRDRNAEASDQVACTAGSATLHWQVPDDAQNQISASGNPSYLRLRITSNTGSPMAPTGLASGSGEVEDYRADVHVPTLTVLTNIVGGRKNAGDQFTMNAQAVSPSTQDLSVTTSGSENGIQAAKIGPRSVAPRSEYRIASTLVPAPSTQPNDYTQTVKCVDVNNNNNASVALDSSGKLQIPNNYDANVQCVYSEKAFPDPALTLVTVVHNRHGGTKTPGDFTFTATDNNSAASTYRYQNTAGGDSYRVAEGDYTITGSPVPDGYREVGPITYVNDATGTPADLVDGKPVLRVHEHIVGTRVVEDLPGNLTLKTVVDPSNGGSAKPSDFSFSVTAQGGDRSDTTPFTEGESRDVNAGTYTIRGSNLPAGYEQIGDIAYTDTTANRPLTPANAQIAIANGHAVVGVRTVRSLLAKIKVITHVEGNDNGSGNSNVTPADFPVDLVPSTAGSTGGSDIALPDNAERSVLADNYKIVTDMSREPDYHVTKAMSCVINNSEDVSLDEGKLDLPNDQSVVCEQTVAPRPKPVEPTGPTGPSGPAQPSQPAGPNANSQPKRAIPATGSDVAGIAALAIVTLLAGLALSAAIKRYGRR